MARGFEEYTFNEDKDSPTCAHEFLLLVIAVLVQDAWKIDSMDIRTVSSSEGSLLIGKVVFIRSPNEATCNKKNVWCKCVWSE